MYSSSRISSTNSTATTTLYPLHRSKTLHLVRHAQGVHNVEGEKDFSAYMSELLFDAQLTQLGWHQVDNLRSHVRESGLSKNIQLVVVSPLLRTMQTAVGVFGGEPFTDDGKAAPPPLMAANAGNSGRDAFSSLNSPPFIALELLREQMEVHPCNRRRSVSEYKPLFPAIDFSLIENDDDVLWSPDTDETYEDVTARGMKFWNWLWTREEKEIAVVSHCGFLYHALRAFGNDPHSSVEAEIRTHFANCELRSVVLTEHDGFRLLQNHPGN